MTNDQVPGVCALKVRQPFTACLLLLLTVPPPICHALDDAGIIQRLNQASRLAAQRKWDAAAAAFNEVLKSDPNNPYALLGVARAHMGRQSWKKAISLLERAQKKLPPKEDSAPVSEWRIIGPFPNPSDGKGLDIAYPPEREIKLDATYDGKPAAVASAKGAMMTVRKSCMSCHQMCRVQMPKAMPKQTMTLPKTSAGIPQFVGGLKGMKSLMMAHQMACGMGAQAVKAGDVKTAALAGAIMRSAQARANSMYSKNKRFVTGGKNLCTAATALEAAAKVPAKIGWQKRSAQDVFNMQRSLPVDNVVFYGFATVRSDRDRVAELRVGSDDGCKVWLNNKLVWLNRARRPVRVDDDRIMVKLRRGDNKLLMKVEQGGGLYGMAAKIVRAPSAMASLRQAKQQYDKIKNKALVRVSSSGLRPDSPTMFWVYKKGRCIKKGRAGRLEVVPQGTYDIRIGFPSGYISQQFDVKNGAELVVPTGLFTFRQVTPPSLASAVPQKLYHLETEEYLVTGYQGMTARLYPGEYRVCYQDVRDEQPSAVFGPWHVVGVFPNPKLNKGFNVVYPPEKQPMPDVTKPCKFGGRTMKWARIEAYPEVNITTAVPGWGVAYATATLESDAEREVGLIMTFKNGIKVWLNGKPIKTVGPLRRAYAMRRTTTFARLKKGRNVLFVKTLRGTYDWPLSAVAVRWKMYDVAVDVESE